MKITVLKEHLTNALSRTGRGISSKAQLPILQNLLIETTKDEISFFAMSMEMTIRHTVHGKIIETGGVCTPARLLSELVATLPDGAVTLETSPEGLLVSCEGFQATIPVVPKEEYPPVSVLGKNKAQPIKKDDLLEALSSVVFSAATDDSRPILTGVRILSKEDETVFATTDGYRLSVKRAGRIFEEPIDKIIPAKALSEVLKMAQEEKELEAIVLSQSQDGQPAFLIGETTLITRTIDGEFPNFERIIPKTYTTKCVFHKDELLRALKSAAIFAKDSANIVKFHISESVNISANTPNVGKNVIQLNTEVEGEGGEIAFNSRFLLDFLANYPQETVVFEMTGSLNSGVFRPERDATYLHIIMPVRVQS